jgi:hypothetical protein
MARYGRARAWRLVAQEMVVLALLAVVVLRTAGPVMSLAVHSQRLPQWDMAKYGVSGLRLVRALQDFDLFALLRHINDLSVWPPLFPLMEVPAFLILGPSFAAARGLVAAFFAMAVVAAFWSGLRQRERGRVMVGALAATLAATSPMTQVFSTLVMLEIPCITILLFSLGFYSRSLRSGREKDFAFACIGATALFFCKYNYGLMWILTMAVNELLRGRDPKQLMSSFSLRGLAESLKRPRRVIIAGACLASVIIELAGPWRVTLAGHEISVSSSGPLLYAVYASFLLAWILRPHRGLELGRRWLARLEPRARTMVLAVAVPLALWMVVPSHAINFVSFLTNRDSGPPVVSFKSLSFYPRVFLDQYSASPAVGVAVLVLVATSLLRLKALDAVGRTLALALLISTALPVAHPYKQPRFLFLAAPLLWLAGSREAAELVARASRRAGEDFQRSIAALIASGALLVATIFSVKIDELEQGHRRHTVHPATAKVLDVISDRAREVRTSVVLGTWNHLSPWLVEWSCLQRRSSIAPTQIPRSPTGREHHSKPIEWLLRDPPDLVMLVSPAPGSTPPPGFLRETRWLDPVRKRLPRDPHFRLLSERDFLDSGYRLQTFKPTRTGGEPVPR